jgi:hypothetical protein
MAVLLEIIEKLLSDLVTCHYEKIVAQGFVCLRNTGEARMFVK